MSLIECVCATEFHAQRHNGNQALVAVFHLQLCVRFMRECITVDTVCEFIQVYSVKSPNKRH